MSLRDEIAKKIVYEHWQAIRGKTSVGDEYHAADWILAKVQEAMMSNDVQAAARVELMMYPRVYVHDMVKTVADIMANALTGDEDFANERGVDIGEQS